MTLTEIVVAVFLLAMIVTPLMQSFSQSRALTQRQIHQEVALKVAEGLLNQVQGVEFAWLAAPPAGASLPFRLELPGGIALRTTLPLAGKPARGSVAFTYGQTPFRLTMATEKVYPKPPAGPTPYCFTYLNDLNRIATYPCPDNFLMVEALVEFRSGLQTATVQLRSAKSD